MVDFYLVDHDGGTRVNVKTDLNMTGMVAQYGRASGLMKEIAGAILGQFAENLRKEIERAPPAAAQVAAAADAAVANAPTPVASAPERTVHPAAPTGPAAPISAFSILWIALKSWIAGLFGRKGN